MNGGLEAVLLKKGEVPRGGNLIARQLYLQGPEDPPRCSSAAAPVPDAASTARGPLAARARQGPVLPTY